MHRIAWRLLPVIFFLLTGTVHSRAQESGLLVSPLSLQFSTVLLGETATRVVEIANVSQKAIELDDLEIKFTRDLRYFQADDECPEDLKKGAKCEIVVRFTPLAVGGQQGEMRIYLDDDDLLADISLAATAVKVLPPPAVDPVPGDPVPGDPVPNDPVPNDPVPNDPIPSEPLPNEPVLPGKLLILGTIYPPETADLAFGQVPLGLAKRMIVTFYNEGPGEIAFGVVPAGAVGEVFEVRGLTENSNHCSEKVLRRDRECSIVVAFRPEAEGVDSLAELAIPYTDAGQTEMMSARVRLLGSAGSATDAFPAPWLIHPEPDQPNLKSSVRFRWSNCRDALGQPASYRLYCSQDPAFTETVPRRIAPLALAALGTGAFLAAGLLPSPRRRAWMLALGLAALLLACSEDIEDSSSRSASGLESGATYHWQVVAEYDEGIEASSEVRSFTVR